MRRSVIAAVSVRCRFGCLPVISTLPAINPILPAHQLGARLVRGAVFSTLVTVMSVDLGLWFAEIAELGEDGLSCELKGFFAD
jgi:hypothetical protein